MISFKEYLREGWRMRAHERKRKGKAIEGSYLSILQAGEKAAREGKSVGTCPYPSGSEDHDIWMDGYKDWKQLEAERKSC